MAPFVKDKKTLVGTILVIAGILLILDNVRFMPHFIPWWVFTWQFLLIGIGVVSLLTHERAAPGIILIFIGVFFLFPHILMGWWPGLYDILDTHNLFWYLLLIVIGISLILKRHRGVQHYRHQWRGYGRRWERSYPGDGPGPADQVGVGHDGESTVESGYDVDDYINEVSVFSGSERTVNSKNFKGGKITCVFGGCEIDLTRCSLAPGVHQIDVLTLFGGWSLITPPNWRIKNEATTIFGGFSDSRKFNTDAVKDDTRVLLIRGNILFGGGELKSY